MSNNLTQHLQESIQIIRTSHPQQSIDYSQLLFLLTQNKIEIIKIRYYLRKKYNNVIPSWNSFSNQHITQDVIDLIKANTERQWEFQNCSRNRFLAKKQLYQKYQTLATTQQKQNRKNRIKTLKDSILKCQANMNLAKKQQQYIIELSKYKQLTEELKYWQEKKRITRDISLKQSAINSPSQNNNRDIILNRIQSNIHQGKLKSKEKSPLPIQKINKKVQLQRLQRIFKHYSNSYNKGSKFFQDIEKDLLKLPLQAYIRFIKEFQICKTLTVESIVKVFKKKTGSSRHINYEQFCQTFIDIYRLQCIKQNIQFNQSDYQNYLLAQIIPSNKIKQILKIKFDSKSNQQRYALNNHHQTNTSSSPTFKDTILIKLRNMKEIQIKKANKIKKLKIQTYQTFRKNGNNKINHFSKRFQQQSNLYKFIFKKKENPISTNHKQVIINRIQQILKL